MGWSCTGYREWDLSYISENNKVGQRETAGPEKVKYYLLRTESPVKGEGMKQGELHNTKISENVGVRSFRKSETSEFRSFPEMENIRKSGVSGNRITSEITYFGNSPEFRVVLEPWERILTTRQLGDAVTQQHFQH